MFSDELEMLIEAAIADGEITEKERAVLHKRAIAEGVDPDELDMIVDSRLSKVKNQSKKEEKTSFAEPRFINILNQKLSKAREEFDDNADTIEESDRETERGNKIATIINTIELPLDKANLLDLIMHIKPYLKKNVWNTRGVNSEEYIIAKAYQNRYKEIIERIKLYFPEDSEFKTIIGEENSKKEKKGLFGGLFSKK